MTCKCGHMLALPKGALASIEKNYQVSIWCTQCGKINYISGKGTITGQRQNKEIVKMYKKWR